MLPSEKNLKSRLLNIRITQLIGVNTASNELYPWKLKLIAAFQCLVFVPQINGLLWIWPDPVNVCHSLMIFVFAVQLIMVGVSRFIKNDAKIIPEISAMVDNFYIKHEKDEEFKEILNKFADFSYSTMKWFTILIFVIFHISAIATWMSTVITGQFYYIAPIYFPFTDPQTLTGYLFNQTYLTLLVTSVYITHSTFTAWYLYLTLQIVPMVEILNKKLDRLGEKLVTVGRESEAINMWHKTILAVTKGMSSKVMPLNSSKQNKNSDKIKITKKAAAAPDLEKQFILIIEEFNTYNEFNKQNLYFMEWTSFVTFSVSFIGISLCIILLRFGSIPVGFTAFVLVISQVLIQCVQGSIVQHQNEKFLNTLCGFPWYELPKDQQKIFLQFIHVCQSACVLDIPMVGKLNMELFTSVINGTYSMVMFMLKFAKF